MKLIADAQCSASPIATMKKHNVFQFIMVVFNQNLSDHMCLYIVQTEKVSSWVKSAISYNVVKYTHVSSYK